MDASFRLAAVEAARDILRRFRQDHPAWQDDQAPVEQIAQWLHCDVATFHPGDYPAGTYGFLEPGEPLIWLCRDLPMTLYRFTLAHELGHVVLHSHLPLGHDLPPTEYAGQTPSALPDELPVSSSDPCHSEDVSEEASNLSTEQQAEELLGPPLAYDPRSLRELAANLFAAELLMPRDLVWELAVVQGLAPDLLATRLGVSLAALLNRLAGLFTETPAPLSTHSLTQSRPPAPTKPVSAPRTYDESQQAAIETPTPALVVAGPGSGKTSTLIGRVEYLLHHQHIQPEYILALTFSRKAAQEMRERLQQILPAGQPLPTVSTFHAFCADLLRTHGPRVGLRQNFALVDDAEGYFLLRGLANRLPLHHYQNLFDPASPFRDFLKAISRAKDELISPSRYQELAIHMLDQATNDEQRLAAERALEVAAVYELYQQRLAQRGDSDFGGLIALAVQLLREHADIRSILHQQYQHILVDEFQDINRASGILLRLLAGEQQRIWVVGDVNQAIYSFRGASPANITHFHEDYPDAHILPLNRNYRSRPDIVSLAGVFKNTLLEQDTQGDTVQTARTTQADPYITLAVAPDEHSELHGLVADIQHRLTEGYTYRDIVVLCRTRALVRKVTQALAEVGLPVGTRTGMLEQEHTKNILSVLLLLVNSSGMGLLRAARLPAHRLEQADIEALLLAARAQQTTPRDLILRGEPAAGLSTTGEQILGHLSTILQNLLRKSNSVWSLLARYLLLETSLGRTLLLAGEDAQARQAREDYAGLLQLAHTYDLRLQEKQHELREKARELGMEPPPLPDLPTQICDFLDYLQILLSLRQESEGKRDAPDEENETTPDVLRVMTVHASKGLEFPVVYLPGLAQRRFPLGKRASATPPPAGMLSSQNEDEQNGEACLFYVATTRARDQLILSYSERYGKQKATRSPYIDALLVGLPAERVQRVVWSLGTGPETASEPAEILQPSQHFIATRQPATQKINQIEDYLVCPRRYAYSTLYAFQQDDGAFLPFWTATEATMKTLVEHTTTNLDDPDPPATTDDPVALFHQHWLTHGRQDGPFVRLYEQHGQEIAQHLWHALQERGDSTWQLRPKLTVELAGQRVEVTIDRIETASDPEQPTRFVRTRYGKRKSKPTAGLRELLYTQAGQQHYAGQNIILQTHNLSTGEIHEMKVSARKTESLLHDLEQALQGITRQEYPPKPDSYICPTCPFYLICPA